MSEHSRWEDVKAHVARRKRYAAAIDSKLPAPIGSDLYEAAGAAMAVTDAEHQVLLTNVREWREDALGWQKLAHKKIEENARLRAIIQRVRALHTADEGYEPECYECFDRYPCATVRALEGETDA